MGLFCQSGIAFRDLAGNVLSPLLVVRVQGVPTAQIVENIQALPKHIASSADALPGFAGRCFRGRGERVVSIAKIFVLELSPYVLCLQ